MQLQLLAGGRGRIREAVQVVGTLAVLLLTAPTLVRAGSVGWRDGVLFAIADAAATILPGNIDAPVALATGVVVGLLLLFAVDTTKRVQIAALSPVVVVVGYLLWQRDHIVDAVGNELLYFLSGVVLAIATTVLLTDRIHLGPEFKPRTIVQELLLMHFPAASKALFAVLTISIAIVTLQYPFMPKSGGDPAFPFVAVAMLFAIPSLAVFIRYTSRKDVVTVTPAGSVGNDVEVCILTGLFSVARQYHGRPTDQHSENLLTEAVKMAGRQPTFAGSVRFRYLPPRLLQRVVEIMSTGYQLSEVTGAYGQWEQDETEPLDPLFAGLRTMKRALWQLVPTVPPSNIATANGALETLGSADTVLLGVPFPDESDVDSLSTDIERAAGLLRVIEARDSERLEGLDAKLVITHADRAENEDDETRYDLDDPGDRELILSALSEMMRDVDPSLEERLELPDDTNARSNTEYVVYQYSDKIYPVAGTAPFQNVRGFDRILDEIGS